MKRKLVIEGNAVYEVDEECMLQKRIDKEKENRQRQEKDRREQRYVQ